MSGAQILIAGASGVVGQAAVEHFAGLPGWTTTAVSAARRSWRPAWRIMSRSI